MILIRKGTPPASLVAYRQEFNAYFDGCNKDDIREKLLEEQGYLCAYCMRRIDKGTMKIEHWYPEERLSITERLDYDNMLGCCMGHIDGSSGKNDTCDSKKGNKLITVDPRKLEHIDQIKYSSKDGRIFSDNSEFEKDIDSTLNLNESSHYLTQGRKAALDEVKNFLSQKEKKGNWTESSMRRLLQRYENANAEGKKKEYAGIVIWYLRKRLNGGTK